MFTTLRGYTLYLSCYVGHTFVLSFSVTFDILYKVYTHEVLRAVTYDRCHSIKVKDTIYYSEVLAILTTILYDLLSILSSLKKSRADFIIIRDKIHETVLSRHLQIEHKDLSSLCHNLIDDVVHEPGLTPIRIPR